MLELQRQILSSDNFFMNIKFLDLDKIYNLHFNEKIVTPKYLPLQAFVIAHCRIGCKRAPKIVALLQPSSRKKAAIFGARLQPIRQYA